MDLLIIGSASLMIGMFVFIYQRMRDAIKHSPKGTSEDWKEFLIPLAGVMAFVALLMLSMR